MRSFRILRRFKRLVQKNKGYLFMVFCSFLYCAVFLQLIGPHFQHKELFAADTEHKVEFTTTISTRYARRKNKDDNTTIIHVLPVLDPFNPFVLQHFVRDLGEMVCPGRTYGRLKNRRLYLPAGMFQEMTYTVLGKKASKVYVVGKRAGTTAVRLGFQGNIKHVSGKCVHPDKGTIKNGVGLIFYKDCDTSARLVYIVDKSGKWRDSSRRYCVQPRRGLLYPPNRTPLEFSTSCGKASLFRPLSNGAIQHVASGLCVHPEYGTGHPLDDEKLVLYDGCHFKKLKFIWFQAKSAEMTLKFPSQHIITKEVIKLEVLKSSMEGVKTEYHVQVIEREEVNQRVRVVPDGEQLHVLLLMFHSMSHAHFRRKMPKLYKFLKNDLQSVIFPGFSLLGEGEHTTTEGILGGLRPARTTGSGTGKPNWLFKIFQDAGYVTMATQDQLDSQELKEMIGKFNASSVDHYPDTLWTEVNKHGNTGGTKLCIGSQFSFNLSLAYLKSFLESYDGIPKFSFMMNSAISSWNLNTIAYAERPLLELLRRKRRLLDKTMVVVYGNHGWKESGLHDTTQGKLEERLPYLSISIPSEFRKKYPEKLNNMALNSIQLVTSLDVHATLRDFLRLSDTGDDNHTKSQYFTQDEENVQGQSLFTKLETRNCSGLGVPEHWCPTVSLRKVKVSKGNTKEISKVIVENLNHILKQAPSGKCKRLKVKKLISVKTFQISDKVLRYKMSKSTPNCLYCQPLFSKIQLKTNDFLYQADMSVEPGGRVYRTLMNLIGNNLYIGDRSRLIKGQPENCLKNDFIASYCVCT